eukprot:SAG22_NODE_537_length_9361_cov_53.700821_6_plen_125_part_00
MADCDESEQSAAITVTVSLAEGATAASSGTARLKLFLHDKMFMDAGAALAGTADVTVTAGAAVAVLLTPDPAAAQVGKTFGEMVQGSYYVSLDIDAGDRTYTAGPAFNLRPGRAAELVLKHKTS